MLEIGKPRSGGAEERKGGEWESRRAWTWTRTRTWQKVNIEAQRLTRVSGFGDLALIRQFLHHFVNTLHVQNIAKRVSRRTLRV
jgi:hypothetical protein